MNPIDDEPRPIPAAIIMQRVMARIADRLARHEAGLPPPDYDLKPPRTPHGDYPRDNALKGLLEAFSDDDERYR